MPDWIIAWVLIYPSFLAAAGVGLGCGYLYCRRRVNDLCTRRHGSCAREHTDEVPVAELRRRVGISDLTPASTPPAPRAFAAGRHPVGQLRIRIDPPTRTLPAVREPIPEEVSS